MSVQSPDAPPPPTTVRELLARHLPVAVRWLLVLMHFAPAAAPAAARGTGSGAGYTATEEEVHRHLVHADDPRGRPERTYRRLGRALDRERQRRRMEGSRLEGRIHDFFVERLVERCHLGLDLAVPLPELLPDLELLTEALAEAEPSPFNFVDGWLVLGRAGRVHEAWDGASLLLGHAQLIAVRHRLAVHLFEIHLERSRLARSTGPRGAALARLLAAWRIVASGAAAPWLEPRLEALVAESELVARDLGETEVEERLLDWLERFRLDNAARRATR